jgi:ABC-type antimicrobial peptide transport system permease subunit
MVREALRGTSLVFAAGLAAGVAATFVLARQLDHIVSGMLIGLRATDWLVVAAAATAMLAVATLAAILPALQAARVDPLIALRAE